MNHQRGASNIFYSILCNNIHITVTIATTKLPTSLKVVLLLNYYRVNFQDKSCRGQGQPGSAFIYGLCRSYVNEIMSFHALWEGSGRPSEVNLCTGFSHKLYSNLDQNLLRCYVLTKYLSITN